MGRLDLVLGLDSSTQGTQATLLEMSRFTKVAEAKIRYRDDARLSRFGLGLGAPILEPLEPGEASQPAELFLEALEAVLSDLPGEELGRVAAVNLSAQQHGQVWLAEAGMDAIAELRRAGRGWHDQPSLARRIGAGFANDRAPIWMSSNARGEAAEIREALGGAVTAISGSDSPARFSGAVLARQARLRPEAYARTARVHLISSFLAGVLAGDPDAPMDWGNASGTGLMDWGSRTWSAELMAATAAAGGLSGGALGLASRLPALAHPLSLVGTIAAYFVERFGFDPDCAVVASSGDNPQTKVLAQGAMLSLGTSFVIMGEGRKPEPAANAMYDGLGRPFLFGCRTNGALVLDAMRSRAGSLDDYGLAEKALASFAPASSLVIRQDMEESFPLSPAMDIGALGDFDSDYSGVVDSSLGLLALASAGFAGGEGDIAATGGAAASRGVLARAANIWGRKIRPIGEAGAAIGAAIAAACALVPDTEREAMAEKARSMAAKPGEAVEPDPKIEIAYRGPGGYLDRLATAFEEATGLRLIP
jgi:xylulokinase